MTLNYRNILAATCISMSLLLSACGKDGKPAEAEASQQQPSADQAEIEKYNAYVDAANGGRDFGEALEQHLKYTPKKLASGEKITSYSTFSEYDIVNLQKALNKALALPYPMPELDGPARALLESVAKLQPIHHEVANYADSKGYLADGGKKARELEPAFEAALTDAAKAQAAFFDGISVRDEINTKTAFEQAPRDTVAYYRAGTVLYAKQSMRLGRAFFETSGDEASTKAFEASLNQTGQMIEGWDKKVRERAPSGCTSMMMSMNDYLGRGRDAIEHARKGEYKPNSTTKMLGDSFNPARRDASHFESGYNSLISALNQDRC